MSPADTRERLLDAAQRLFVQTGVSATSLRSITTEADANLASVNYYFGSKEAMVQAVFFRWLEPLNKERLKWLDRVEEEAGDGPLEVEAVLGAFLGPTFHMMRDERARDFPCLFGRLHAESDELTAAIFEQFHDVQVRFIQAFLRALPHLNLPELAWRMHFLIGAMAYTFGAADILKFISKGQCTLSDLEGALKRLIAFSAAGLKTPVPDQGDTTQ